MTDDLLKLHIKTLPAFRGLLRAVEARFYGEIELPEPVLDLGCGDGHFASLALHNPLRAGIDMERRSLRDARVLDVHETLAQAEGAHLPFDSGSFASVVSNSVLEHILDIEPVLLEVSRVMRSGALFVFSVPSEHFQEFLSVSEWLRGIGLYWCAQKYERFFNYISRHQHCDSPVIWEDRLNFAGFDVERYWYYFSRKALRALEWGHYLGVPALVAKAITGRWIISPGKANLWLTERIIRRHYEEELPMDGAYIFWIARKR